MLGYRLHDVLRPRLGCALVRQGRRIVGTYFDQAGRVHRLDHEAREDFMINVLVLAQHHERLAAGDVRLGGSQLCAGLNIEERSLCVLLKQQATLAFL